MKTRRTLLILAGSLAFFMSLGQVALGIIPEWSAAFGAPEALLSNPRLLLLSSLVVAGILAIMGLYGLSGAGVIRRLPLLRLGLLGIGLGFTLYGINLIPQLMVVTGLVPSPYPVPLRNIILFSVLLLAGVLYLAGLAVGWKHLSAAATDSLGARAKSPDSANSA